ncbi:phage conserved hypothetical protein BR0599 [Devosia enhydra]|uniref:Bacteriophage phiJL001 Gp84 C-terminal domain-containing protein n=1 Tax=Devosia enhydra TaxID=665118 RepID=A0A1K2I0S2_9HYPH|nr:DUF2163 domain-containing protein [Devosia enhydra]SFZ85871.1 phage conserved hypothetical protein BR0599 [Devosia enhydra]
MRVFADTFADHIASGATTLATCWRIARSDGVVLGFTDHDRPLAFEGTDFLPTSGLEGGEVARKLGAQIDTGEVAGVIASDAIAEADILLGRYDGARVETYRVNWRAPETRALMAVATIGEIVREDGAFRAELRSGQAALGRVSGRICQPLCDAELGDARCGVDVSAPALRAELEVLAVLDRYRLQVAGLSGFAPGWFTLGRAQWTSGGRSGIVDRIISQSRQGEADVLGFAEPVGERVVAGDLLVVIAGCDRRFATCREKFANAVNFRGFPHVPGSDLLLRYPRSGDVLDGRPLVS